MSNNKYNSGLLSGLGSGLLLSAIISDFFFAENNSAFVTLVLAISFYSASWYFGKKK